MSDSPESPARFNLEFLRKAARRLTRAARSGDADAITRLQRVLPRLARLDAAAVAAQVRLADTQQALAREHGYANWAALTRAGGSLEPLLVAVRGGDLATITMSLDAFSPLSRESAHAAAALGDAAALGRHLDNDPTLATTEHADWHPLDYVCASPVHRLSGRHSAGLLECATILLDRGVDVNTATPSTSDGTATLPVPASFRAQQSGNFAVMMLLQRRGADERALRPHVTKLFQTKQPWSDTIAEFYARPEVVRELTATIDSWKATHHPTMRGHFTPLDLREFHDVTAGALTPPLVSVPMWAVPPVDRHSAGALLVGVTHTFPPTLVELLLSRGFDCRQARVNGRSLVSMAIRGGRRAVADLLRSHGAPDDDVEARDELVGACLRLDSDAARAIAQAHPNIPTTMASEDFDTLAAAARSSLDHLCLMLEMGFPVGGRGTAGVTALHLAAWYGRVDAVRLLLGHRASPDARDVTYDATPREWAAHGAAHCRTAEAGYREVLALLNGPG